MPARACCVLVALCVVTGTTQVLGAQAPAQRVVRRPHDAAVRAAQWVAAVLGHRAAMRDTAVEEIARWDPAAVNDLAIEVHAIRRLMRDRDARTFVMPAQSGIPPPLLYSDPQIELLRGAADDAARAGLDEDALVARGLLLHTDIALLGNAGGTLLHFADGRDRGLQRRADHWAIGRGLAALLDERSPRQADVRLWYRATLAVMAAADTWNVRHADAAAAQRPSDPELLFLAAAHHETLASPRVQAALAAARMPRDLVLDVGSAREELRLAETLLKRALDVRPQHTDARIRRGRVLVQLGRAREAVPELRRAAAEATRPEQHYYAQLFLGAALEAGNERQAARTAYSAAAALFPRAQSPHLALSHLAMRAGDRFAAMRAIEPVLNLPADEARREDPWWTYARVVGRDANQLMAQARERLAAAPSRSPR